MFSSSLCIEKFSTIDIADPFFDSLKEDYQKFEYWFNSKAEYFAYTFRKSPDAMLDGFLYLKEETGTVNDTSPPLPSSHRLKIGTFKINPHGTRLGERFIKRAFDEAVLKGCSALYVTIFEKHEALIPLFQRYGFEKAAVKISEDGQEVVFEKRLDRVFDNVVLNYPRIPFFRNRHFLLSIQPSYHSYLLPDSLLKTEKQLILEDVSHTNSIHKIYLSSIQNVSTLKAGDTLLIYRTADRGAAYYTSVVTSLCVVDAVKHLRDFSSETEFLAFCEPYSIFTRSELVSFYRSNKYPWIICFTYNIALSKRITNGALIEEVGLRPNYWGFVPLSTEQFREIIKLSGDYEKVRTLIYTP